MTRGWIDRRRFLMIGLSATGTLLVARTTRRAAASGPTSGVIRATAVPTPGAWVLSTGLITARSLPSVVLLPNGQILVAGGVDVAGAPIASSELVNQLSGNSMAAGSEVTARKGAVTIRLFNGKVLRAGGLDTFSNTLGSAELFDPTTGTWSPTGSLITPRWSASAATLHDGTILVFGGETGVGASSALLGTAEIYDPRSGAWSPAGTMTTSRNNPTAVSLNLDGKLLFFGGTSGTSSSSPPLATSEIFDPASRTWSPTGNLNTARSGYTTNQIPTNGKVLVAGGADASGNVLGTAEIYDPLAGAWSFTSTPMATPRTSHQAMLLAANGQVLVAGGLTGSALSTATNLAERYDPVQDAWTGTGSLRTARSSYYLADLSGQGVLFAYGGTDVNGLVLGSGELYDPFAGNWSETGSMNVARTSSGGVGQPDQTIARVGGKDSSGLPLASVELYEETLPAISAWSATGAMLDARTNHGQVLLPNGGVLVAGGQSGATPLASAELYDEVAGTWSATGSLSAARSALALTRLPIGTILATGGIGSDGSSLASAEIYHPTSGSWSTAASMATARSGHAAVVLGYNGLVLVAGGGTASAELYDPVANAWTSTGAMSVARTQASLTALNTGSILVAGGVDANGNAQASAELYKPETGTWSATGSLNQARSAHRATALPDGKILVAGGLDANGNALASAELYDPIAGTWSFGASLRAARASFTLIGLPNGESLVAGGVSRVAIGAAELYDQGGEQTLATVAMTTARQGQGSVLLPNGKVLVAGGSDASGATLASAELYQESYPVKYRQYLSTVAVQGGP